MTETHTDTATLRQTLNLAAVVEALNESGSVALDQGIAEQRWGNDALMDFYPAFRE